jgi:hypothetical protein
MSNTEPVWKTREWWAVLGLTGKQRIGCFGVSGKTREESVAMAVAYLNPANLATESPKVRKRYKKVTSVEAFSYFPPLACEEAIENWLLGQGIEGAKAATEAAALVDMIGLGILGIMQGQRQKDEGMPPHLELGKEPYWAVMGLSWKFRCSHLLRFVPGSYDGAMALGEAYRDSPRKWNDHTEQGRELLASIGPIEAFNFLLGPDRFQPLVRDWLVTSGVKSPHMDALVSDIADACRDGFMFISNGFQGDS